MTETEAARLLTRMAMLGLGSRPADKAESAIRTQEWALALKGVSEAEATNAAREIASTPGQRFGIRPGDLLEVVYSERLKEFKPRRNMPIIRTPDAKVDHAAAVAHDHPQWHFAGDEGGRESPLHYIVRLTTLACLIPIGDATIGQGGVYSCGVQDCVDCTRMPLPPTAAAQEVVPF